MSSKEQYKDALKRANRIIAKLNVEMLHLRGELSAAKTSIDAFKQILARSNKPWWQFWK